LGVRKGAGGLGGSTERNNHMMPIRKGELTKKRIGTPKTLGDLLVAERAGLHGTEWAPVEYVHSATKKKDKVGRNSPTRGKDYLERQSTVVDLGAERDPVGKGKSMNGGAGVFQENGEGEGMVRRGADTVRWMPS